MWWDCNGGERNMGYVNRQTEWGNQRTDSFKVYLFAKEHQPSCWKVPFYYPLVRRSLHVFLKVSNDGVFLWNFLYFFTLAKSLGLVRLVQISFFLNNWILNNTGAETEMFCSFFVFTCFWNHYIHFDLCIFTLDAVHCLFFTFYSFLKDLIYF